MSFTIVGRLDQQVEKMEASDYKIRITTSHSWLSAALDSIRYPHLAHQGHAHLGVSQNTPTMGSQQNGYLIHEMKILLQEIVWTAKRVQRITAI